MNKASNHNLQGWNLNQYFPATLLLMCFFFIKYHTEVVVPLDIKTKQKKTLLFSTTTDHRQPDDRRPKSGPIDLLFRFRSTWKTNKTVAGIIYVTYSLSYDFTCAGLVVGWLVSCSVYWRIVITWDRGLKITTVQSSLEHNTNQSARRISW